MDLGYCMRDAAEQFLYRNSDNDIIFKDFQWNLTHGVVTGTFGPAKGTKFVHAWLECHHLGLVWDPANRIAPIDLYYNVGKVGKVVVYTSRKVVSAKLFQTRNWGPWDKELLKIHPPKEVLDSFKAAKREEIEQNGAF